MFNNLLKQDQTYINRWVITYADFITMLLALFMVMYALSRMDINNLKEFSKSLESVFSLTQTEIKFSSSEFDNIQEIVNEKLNKIEGISISREPRGLLITLSNGILFDTGSDIIRQESIILIDKIAEIIKQVPNSVKIEGHTDDVPIKTSKFPSN